MPVRRRSAAGPVAGSLAGVVALGLVTGCSSAANGKAAPSTPVASSASRSAQAEALAKRPRELSLVGVDPCSVLTDTQLDQLNVTSRPRELPATGGDGAGCAFDVDRTKPYYSLGVQDYLRSDLADWLTGARHRSSMTTQNTTVADFPALTWFRAAPDPDDCQKLVGVAAGQTMAVRAYPVTAGAFSQQQLCDLAGQAATLVLQTLQARK